MQMHLVSVQKIMLEMNWYHLNLFYKVLWNYLVIVWSASYSCLNFRFAWGTILFNTWLILSLPLLWLLLIDNSCWLGSIDALMSCLWRCWWASLCCYNSACRINKVIHISMLISCSWFVISVAPITINYKLVLVDTTWQVLYKLELLPSPLHRYLLPISKLCCEHDLVTSVSPGKDCGY